MDVPQAQSEIRIIQRLRELFEAQQAEGDSVPSETLAADLDRLFGAHADRVRALCLRLTRDPDRARDLAQEAMLKAWQNLPNFRGESGLGTWLFVIARNVCFQSMRKRTDLLTEDGIVELASPEAGALRQLQLAEREELLREASAAVLSPLEQEAVHLRYVEQLGQDEITVILGLDQSSGARGLLQRCRRKLKRELRRRLAEMGHGSTFVNVEP